MADTGSVNLGNPSFFDNNGNATTDQPPFEITWADGPWTLVGARSRDRNVNLTLLSLVRTGNEEIEVDTAADVESESTFGFRLQALNDSSKTLGWQIRPDTRNPYISNLRGVRQTAYRQFYDRIRTTDSFILFWDKNGIPPIPTGSNVSGFNLGGGKLYSGGMEHRLIYAGGGVIFRNG